MGNLMTSMYTGVSGLIVSQTSINTTAHNISNVDTKGYTRQQILSSDFRYNTIGQTANSYLQVGLGADMSSIRQVRDMFLDKSYRLEIGRENYYEAQSNSIEEIESIFGELDGEAFKTSLSDLWTSISELAKEPLNTVNRGTLVATASSFLARAEIIKEQLSSYQTNLNSQILKKVNRINEIGDSIKGLNQKIRTNESSGQEANDYRDTRNSLLDELGGLASISYKEDAYGMVTVSVEGVQFVTDDNVYHMATHKTVTEEEQGRTDSINGYVKDISDLAANLKSAGKTPDEINDGVKASDAWSKLSKYGALTYPTSGELKYNNYTAIESNGTIHSILPKQSDLLTVVWTGNGCGDVFRLNGNYSSASNTDVGSLKGLLVSRGAYSANYTNIPLEKDYATTKEYEIAVKEYNRYVDPSVIMSTQAQFDQLIHEMVTSINDILAPNTEVSSGIISKLRTNTTGTTVNESQVNLTGATIVLEDGTTVKASDVQIFDSVSAGCGMDDEQTQGEALFERKNQERYTKGKLTAAIDGVPTEIHVWVYNEEYASDQYSLYTIGEVEINEDILNDYNVIPLSNNQYSGLSGSYNQDICSALTDAWDRETLKIDPNTLTTNNFQDYYSALTTNIAYRGSTYKSKVDNQSDMVESIDNQRQTVAGVSSDEELTNLIKFQHAYNASSRYINVINEMLGHVIEKLG
ncbi:MAG: flagellar hook-associated protein FlgK [Velocimicrobium sp.]